WPEEAPFHTPVFVVTHTKRDPWERPGGTTFHFVNDGIESALLQAREAAGDRDVRIAGGAETIQEYLDGGLIDEFSITLAPVLFGTGIRLFDRVDPARLALDQARTDASPPATHLTYTAVNRWRACPRQAVPACPRRARCGSVRSAGGSGGVIEFAGRDAADDGADLGLTDNGACYRSNDFARSVGQRPRHQKTKPDT